MTQNGKVISVEGEKAKVVVMRRSACEGCKQKTLCAGVSDGCADGKPVEAVVKNTVGACVGDEVVLESSSMRVLGMTFAVFVLPILVAFAAYAVASSFLQLKAVYIISVISFVVPLVLLCYLLNRSVKKNPGIEIVKIIKKEI